MEIIDRMINALYSKDKKFCFDEKNIKEFEEEIDKLLDKELPVNVEYSSYGYGHGVYKCPMCDSDIHGIYEYCPECGQKIDYGC